MSSGTFRPPWSRRAVTSKPATFELMSRGVVETLTGPGAANGELALLGEGLTDSGLGDVVQLVTNIAHIAIVVRSMLMPSAPSAAKRSATRGQ